MYNKINKMFDEMMNDLNYLKIASVVKTKFAKINDEIEENHYQKNKNF